MIIDSLKEMAHVTLVDGCFDPLHHGHVEYFRQASMFGDPVFCYVSGDHYLLRKHKPLLSGEKRILIIDAIRYINFCHLGNTSTADALERIRPKRYLKGKDWLLKGLPEKEVEICEKYAIEVAFVDATLDSSTNILKSYLEDLK